MASSKSAAASVRAAASLSAFVEAEAFVSRSAVTSPDVRLRLCSLASEAGDRGSLPAREGLGSPEPPAAAAPSSGPAPRCCALACCSDIASAWQESEGDVSWTRSPVDRNLERDDEDGAFAGRTDGARAGVSGGSRAGDMPNARVTHHLQQLIVVVVRHRHDARTE